MQPADIPPPQYASTPLLRTQQTAESTNMPTTNSEVFKRKFFELRSEFSHHIEIYTDGSKDGIRTAAAVVAPKSVKTVRLPDDASIFTAEIHALDMALDIIRRTRSKDYLSSLQAIENCKVENPLILKILKDHNRLCLLYTSPSPRDRTRSRMPSSA